MSLASPASPARDDAAPLIVWIGFAAMLLGNFMAILDIQIVASSIGAIQAGVSASQDEIGRVQTAYLVAEVVGIPLCGFLGRALGGRLLFCTSAFLFAVSSLACSSAWSISSLVVFRAMQGFSGAAMIPTTMATLFLVIPQRQQAMAGAILGMVMTLGSALGPTIGGYISDQLGWRALFWINVAPGMLVTFVVWTSMSGLQPGSPGLLRKLDFIGLVGLAFFLGGAEYALEEGPGGNWFASSEVVFWVCVSACAAALFFWRALSAENPIVDLRPFANPTFAIGASMGFILGLTTFTSIFLTPVFLGSVRGYSPLQIGHTMIVQGLTMFVSALVVGRWTRSLNDTRLVGFAGMLLIGLSCWMQAGMTSQAGFWELAWPQMVRGVGFMLSFPTVMQPAIRSLPPAMVHSGSALFSTTRNLGGALGIAGLATVHAHAFALHRQELYSAADASNPHVQGMIAGAQAYLEQAGAADPARQSIMMYASILDREALTMTFNDQFMVMAIVILSTSFAMFFLRPSPTPADAPSVLASH